MDELDILRAFRAPLADVDADARKRVAARIAHEPAVSRRRSARRRRPVLLLLLALAAMLIADAISGAADGVLSLVGVTDDASSPVPVAGGSSVPAIGYVLGSELRDAAGNVHRLSVPAGPASFLMDAQGSRSGQVVYVAGTVNQSLRLFDPATGTDCEIDASGTLPAWRHDGALGYVQYAPGTGASKVTIVVRQSPTAAATTWSTRPGYEPLAWAGDSLIIAQQLAAPNPTLLAFTGPGSVREVGSGALIAISPDGTQLLIADGASLDRIPSSSHLRLVDLASEDRDDARSEQCLSERRGRGDDRARWDGRVGERAHRLPGTCGRRRADGHGEWARALEGRILHRRSWAARRGAPRGTVRRCVREPRDREGGRPPAVGEGWADAAERAHVRPRRR